MMGDVFRRARLETAIWAGKLMLLCVGTVSTLVFFKAAIVPYLVNLSLSIVPHLWTSFKSCCLSPLYIYLILNSIIITILASSTFQRQNQNQNQNQKQHQHPSSPSFSSSSSVVSSSSCVISDNAAHTTDNIDCFNTSIYNDPDDNNRDDKYSSSIIQSQSLSQQQQEHGIQGHSKKEDATSPDNHQFPSNEMLSWHDIHVQAADDAEADQEESISNCIMPTTLSTSLLRLDDYEHHRFDPSPDMCSGEDFLRHSDGMPTAAVDVGDNMNTLDTTWKAIMEGQGKAIDKQLKKSDTWDTPPRLTGQLALKQQLQLDHHRLNDHDHHDEEEEDAVTWARRELKKSDTYSDRVSLRREKPMTQDELKQRAEAFINKFNNDMRLQRLESNQRRFREIVNRGY